MTVEYSICGIVGGGSGGVFSAEVFVSDQTIASGQTGDLVTIGTSGKLTKLTFLATSVAGNQPDITVTSDGFDIVSARILSPITTPSDDEFYISEGYGAAMQGSQGNLTDVYGEFITISKGAGNTVTALKYAYITGAIK